MESKEFQQFPGRPVIPDHEPVIVDVPEAHDKQVCFPSVLLLSPMDSDFSPAIVCCSAAEAS